MGCCGKVAGAVKMARAEMGIRVIRLPQVVAAKRAACESCPKWNHGRCFAPGDDGRPCECYTWAKTMIPGEKCPLGRWPTDDAIDGVRADKD